MADGEFFWIPLDRGTIKQAQAVALDGDQIFIRNAPSMGSPFLYHWKSIIDP